MQNKKKNHLCFTPISIFGHHHLWSGSGSYNFTTWFDSLQHQYKHEILHNIRIMLFREIPSYTHHFIIDRNLMALQMTRHNKSFPSQYIETLKDQGPLNILYQLVVVDAFTIHQSAKDIFIRNYKQLMILNGWLREWHGILISTMNAPSFISLRQLIQYLDWIFFTKDCLFDFILIITIIGRRRKISLMLGGWC